MSHLQQRASPIRPIMILLMLIPTFLVGCSSVVKAPQDVPSLSQQNVTLEQEYQLKPSDQLDIKFYETPELNESISIRPDGRISLQLIPEVMASGKTAAQLTAELTELYSKEFKEPRVSVIVKSFTDQRIYVAGEVNEPTLIDLLGRTTILQAVAQAGGLKYTAKRNEIVVIRHQPNAQPQVFQIDIDKAISGTDLAQNMVLRPLDVVYIPRTSIANVDQWIDEHFYKLIPLSFNADYDLNP